jgi:hypothetical protein
MALTVPKRFAVDTNFPLDLAADKDFAHKLLRALQLVGYSLYLPPTAVGELLLISRRFHHPANGLACKALECLTAWEIAPYDLKSVGHGITELFARTLITRKLLPEEEYNDGLILAEASLMEATALMSADQHLTSIDSTTLNLIFEEREMKPILVIHPRHMVEALKRSRRS